MSDESTVLSAHRALYDAVESGDADLMGALWIDAADTTCIHPGAPTLRGTSEILRSWLVLMAHVGYIQFFLTDVEVAVLPGSADGPTTAVVTCTENIMSGDADAADGLASSFGSGTAISTSVLVRDGAGWKFWSRHASPAPIDPDTLSEEEV